MRKSTKAGLVAGVSTLTGVTTLVFSPGAGREALGTMALIIGVVGVVTALRLRLAAD